MNFRRIIQLTSSLAAALTLTACGGGDTGPQWAQDLKDTIVYGELQLPVGTFYSPCTRLSGVRPQSFIVVNIIEKRSRAYYLTTKEEWYDDLGCSDSKKLYTLTNPDARLTYIGTGEDTTAGLTYQRARSVSAGGDVQIKVENGAPVTFTPLTDPTKVRIKFTSGAFFEYDQTVVFPPGATDTAIFAQDERSLYLGDPASSQEQVGDDSFPTKLKTDFPYRPYRFISITPGTYANGTATTDGSTPDCDAITLPDADGVGKTYGYIVKVVAAPIDQDYRPEISLEFDYFSDLNCNNRLVTIKSPPVLLETVGNGIDPTLGVTYRQVLQQQQAGTFTATSTPGDARVTVTAGLVTFVNDRVTIPIGPAEASTTFDSFYFKEDRLYEGDKMSVNSAVSPFPTALLLDYPYLLVN